MLRRKTYKNAKLNEGVRSTYQANNKIKKTCFTYQAKTENYLEENFNVLRKTFIVAKNMF